MDAFHAFPAVALVAPVAKLICSHSLTFPYWTSSYCPGLSPELPTGLPTNFLHISGDHLLAPPATHAQAELCFFFSKPCSQRPKPEGTPLLPHLLEVFHQPLLEYLFLGLLVSLQTPCQDSVQTFPIWFSINVFVVHALDGKHLEMEYVTSLHSQWLACSAQHVFSEQEVGYPEAEPSSLLKYTFGRGSLEVCPMVFTSEEPVRVWAPGSHGCGGCQGTPLTNFVSYEIWFECSLWGDHLVVVVVFNVYLFLRDRDTDRGWAGEGRERERGRHRIWSRFQAPSCQHRAWWGTRTHKPWDHDLSSSWTLNWLSPPQEPQETT